MDQESAGGKKRKRKPGDNAGAPKRKPRNNTGARKSSNRRGSGAGEQQQQQAAAAIEKVAECVRLPEEEEEENYEGITEESIAEMMSWLALELVPPPAPAGRSCVSVQGSNMESCGPSFSGSASTVMASVDFRFAAPVPQVVPWPWPSPAAEAVPVAGPQGEEGMADDEWVAGLLTDGPPDEGLYY
ncbi:hypothetical protein BRADI_2g33105v3 [Brachypodium distachyon]|uniref:Uncharacterized protein n=1 Tax=Brachypodium distachyon TaxID=15368 RepID=A0A0Q3IMJ1_BRADI|nr:hypothetical protein BRADI_2g33105v3 [Brachypodium distachyon]